MTLDLSKIGDKLNYCFVNESLGIAFEFLIAVIHNAGLVSLTYSLSLKIETPCGYSNRGI